MILINAAHWHLMLNHFPVIGTLTGLLILIVSILRKNQTLRQTALVIFIFSSVFTIPVYLTGEGAEEVLEQVVAGNMEQAIELHEEAAGPVAIGIYALGGLSLISLYLEWRGRRNSVKFLNAFIAFLAFIVFVAIFRVANMGGEIRHTEIRGSQIINPIKNDKHENDDY